MYISDLYFLGKDGPKASWMHGVARQTSTRQEATPCEMNSVCFLGKYYVKSIYIGRLNSMLFKSTPTRVG